MHSYNSIDHDHSLYPQALKCIDPPIKKIYIKGDPENLNFTFAVGVVGSRHMTAYGNQVLSKVFSELKSYGVVIVSGFMYGVDALSHTLALQNNLKTVAVMPCGIDLICPAHQTSLYDGILDSGGCVMSEYSPGVSPKAWTFPARNRIVAALSKCVLVVEAGIKSGSLITARYAKKYGKRVFVVPGNIFSETQAGIYQLIKEGAQVISSGHEIVEYLGLRQNTSPKAEHVTKDTIIKYLPAVFDDLLLATNFSGTKLRDILLDLEYDGQIKQEGGLYYLS